MASKKYYLALRAWYSDPPTDPGTVLSGLLLGRWGHSLQSLQINYGRGIGWGLRVT